MIYTKTGDKGKTSLFEPDPNKRVRVSKSSLRIEAIGAIDEANSYLGIANFHTSSTQTKTFVKAIQKNLFTVGAILSKAQLKINKEDVIEIERRIDRMEEKLPPLRNFVMPEGSESAVHFMYARSLIRAAERRVVAVSKKETISAEVLQYLNRLSDYLFVVFRDENKRAKVSEELWVGKKR